MGWLGYTLLQVFLTPSGILAAYTLHIHIETDLEPREGWWVFDPEVSTNMISHYLVGSPHYPFFLAIEARI